MTNDKQAIKDAVIKFSAQVSKVTTMADGSLRIVLDLPETAIETATKMMQVKRNGGLLEVAAVAIDKVKSGRKPRKTEEKPFLDEKTLATY